MHRKLWTTCLALALAGAGWSQSSYAQSKVDIKAGILLVDSQRTPLVNGVPSNYTPHVWFNLDANRLMKPAGWNIMNPRASTQVTPEIQARWITLVGAANAPNVGDRITKRQASYWEVPLSSAGDAEISDYDVLLLSARGFVALNPKEREKLRRFVDKGGVLWVDFTSTANLDSLNSVPIPFGRNGSLVGPGRYAEYLHPLLSFPNTINDAALQAMETDLVSGIAPSQVTDASLMPLVGSVVGDTTKLYAVAGTEYGPSIAVGRLGDGFVVVTARGVSTALNRVVGPSGYNPNTGYLSANATSDRAANSAASLVVNLINLGASQSQTSGVSRKSNSSSVDISAPLLRRFDVSSPLSASTRGYPQPVTYKGLLIVTTLDKVQVFDANPSSDLDGDGDPDDGLRDFSRGAKYDLLWESRVLAGPLSAPAATEISDAAGAPRDQILVAGINGEVYIFDAFQLNGAGLITPTTTANPSVTVQPPSSAPPTWDLTMPDPGPYAPTIHEGIAYVVDSHASGLGNRIGRAWQIDLRTGARVSSGSGDFIVGGPTGSYGTIPDVSASATVGYIPVADNSGALDRVMYIPTRNTPGSLSPAARAGIYSLWLGVRSETIKDRTIQPGLFVARTRAQQQGVSIFTPANGSLALKLTVVDASGNPWNEAQMTAVFTGGPPSQPFPGELQFALKPGGDVLLANATVTLDYTLDWGVTTGPLRPFNPIVRGSVNFPDDSAGGRRILNTVALSPRGTIFAVHGNKTQGGSLYALKEDGRGTFKLLYRYELYNQHQINLNQASPVTYRETLVDTDPVRNFAPGFLNGSMVNLAFQGGPSVRNDTVYVVARGFKNIFVPHSVIMAFQAEPQPLQIRVGELPNNFTIVQPDLARSNNKAIPEQFSQLQAGQYVYERDPGSDTGTIRLDNLANVTRGPIIHSLSSSQPIIIRRGGQPDLLFEPASSSQRWSPLVWFTVWHGVDSVSPPVVTGETLFAAGSSVLPDILVNGAFSPRGVLMGMDATISPTDPFLSPDPLRSWQKQLWVLRDLGGGNIDSNPDIRWPQGGGVRSFDDWQVRYLQTVMGPGPGLGVTAGDGALFAWQNNAVWSYSRADLLVADELRLTKFDPSGNPIWSSDLTANAGDADTSNTATVKPLVRPTRAYPLSSTEMLVVDTGGDRIVRMDTSGREIRSITGFKLDPANVPEGYEASESLSLKQPRDVVMFRTYEANPAGVTNPRPLEYWVHYLIADSGNKRLVEVIDRYEADPATRRVVAPIDLTPGDRAIGVLRWHSPASLSNKGYTYTSVARVWNEVSGRYVFAAGIGGALPTKVDLGLDSPGANKLRETGTGNGGIVVFDGANTAVINEIVVPAIGQDVYWSDTAGAFSSAPRAQQRRAIGNVNSVTMRVTDLGNGPVLSVMFTDEGGVFEVVPSGPDWVVRWMMPREAFRVMRRQGWPPGQPWLGAPIGSNAMDLRAAYARRLDSGDVLIVNSFQGQTRARTSFAGEVVQINGDLDTPNSTNNAALSFSFFKYNFGFRSPSVQFELPPVQGTRGIVIPVFADRR